MFITLEAGEGAGKSTQARKLGSALKEMGYDVVMTREPGGSPLAEELRNIVVQGDPDRMDALTELLIFTAARRDHINKTIRPALERGAIVICDRYLGSTHALQGAGGTPHATIDMLHQTFCQLTPDLTLFLEMDSKAGLERAMGRLTQAEIAESRFEAKGQIFHQEVDRIFRTQCETRPEWTAVDANGTIEEVSDRILSTVLSHDSFPKSKLATAV